MRAQLNDVIYESVAIPYFVVVPSKNFHQVTAHHASEVEVSNGAVGTAKNVRRNKLFFCHGKNAFPPHICRRSLQNIIHFLSGSFSFSNESDIDERARHYWHAHRDTIEQPLKFSKRLGHGDSRSGCGGYNILRGRAPFPESSLGRTIYQRLGSSISVRSIQNRVLNPYCLVDNG